MVPLGRGADGGRRRFVDTLSTLGQRFERSMAGQVFISAVVSVVVLIGVVWNLPNSEIKRTLTPTLRPIASAAGLEQSWQMYAPEPISSLEGVQVLVRMEDGSTRSWTPQRGGRVVGPFAWYHWQKIKEQTVREEYSRAGIAHWVVRELTTPAERPVRVQMMFREELLPAPGKDGPRTVTVTTLYDETLGGQA